MYCPACKDSRVYGNGAGIIFCSYCKHNLGEQMNKSAFQDIVGTFLFLSKENRDYVRALLANYTKD